VPKKSRQKRKTLSAWFRSNRTAPPVGPRYTEAHFEPYAKAIGSLLLAWNDLHEQLSRLFIMAMGIEQFVNQMPFGISRLEMAQNANY
jgi:hypothetical protein